VLVTSQDPLEIYMFDSCYFRLCSSAFSLDDLTDKAKHLANFSVQKSYAKGSLDETVMSLSEFLIWLHDSRSEVSWN
jgi:hypothetical protein